MQEQATRRRRRIDEEDDEERRPASDTGRRRRQIDPDEQDDRPRSRRRDERDEERPRGRRDERDEERPRGRRDERDEERPRSRRHEEDEERPSRSRDEQDDRPRSRRRDEDDERPRSRRRDEDDEEDRPRGRRSTGEATGGWGAAQAVMAESGGFATSIKFTNEPLVVKFLEDEPFDAYRTHWLDEISKGRKKFRCLKEDCPLCDPFGDETNGSSIQFNVVSFERPKSPAFGFIDAGTRLSRALQTIAEDERYHGLSDPRLYVAISVTGPKKNPEFQAKDVKARDLYEDWGIDALTDDEIETFERKMYTGPVEELPTRAELQDIVKELTKPRR